MTARCLRAADDEGVLEAKEVEDVEHRVAVAICVGIAGDERVLEAEEVEDVEDADARGDGAIGVTDEDGVADDDAVLAADGVGLSTAALSGG